MRRHRMVVRSVPGLEGLVRTELLALQVARARVASPGVVIAEHVTTRQLYAANAFLRTASRVLLPLCEFKARSFIDLELAVKRLRAEHIDPWLVPHLPLGVVVRASGSPALYHTSAIRQRLCKFLERPMADVADAGSARASQPESQRLEVVVRGERVSLFVDASGGPLHERSWRQGGAKMPMKVSVAAGLLMSSGWLPNSFSNASAAGGGGAPRALLDPFCGSGAIAIEAACLALGSPPHCLQERYFALQQWPAFEPGVWASVRGEATERTEAAERRRDKLRPPTIVGSDRDAGAIATAQMNAARAGVSDLIDFHVAPISTLRPPPLPPTAHTAGSAPSVPTARGLVLTNPPWGHRSAGSGDLRNLYARLGQVVAKHCPSYSLAILVDDKRLARHAGGTRSQLKVTIGGKPVWLMVRDADELMTPREVREGCSRPPEVPLK